MEKLKSNLVYLWEYYRVVLFVIGAILLLFIYVLGNYFVTLSTTYWNVVSLNTMVTSESSAWFEAYFEENDESYEINLDNQLNFSVDESDMMGMNNMAKFTALIAAKDIDLVVGDLETVEHYGVQGGFIDLSEWVAPEFTADLVETDGQVFAIELPAGMTTTENTVAAIPGNSEHIEQTVDLLNQWLGAN